MAGRLDGDPDMASRTRFWNVVLVVLAAVNLAAVWFAAGPGGSLHPTAHAAAALGFGIWAQRRILRETPQRPAEALGAGSEDDIAALQDEAGDVRRELSEMQERLDFAERLLAQAQQARRVDPPPRPGP